MVKMNKTRFVVSLALALWCAACSRDPRQRADGSLAPERASASARVVLQNKGSDTLVNVAQAWAEAYKTKAPRVAIAVTGGGSGTGISALINGTVDIANTSRALKEKERQMAVARGVQPVEHVVGYDALAVFLHKNNPLKEISLAQLAGIYADGGETETWSQLGVSVPGCDSDEIIVISRQNNSGTYAYFKEAVLQKRDYKLGTRDLHGSKDVVDLVAKTPCAIGYSGLAYATDQVAMPCIKMERGCVKPTVSTALDKGYPIARPLFMYTNGEPSGFVADYLSWIKSAEGQCIIRDKGYGPAIAVDCG